MNAMSDEVEGYLTYGPGGIEAEYLIDELALGRPEELGEAAVRHRRVGEVVLGAVDAGADPLLIVDALVIAGAATRQLRMRDRLPGIRSLPGVRRSRTYRVKVG